MRSRAHADHPDSTSPTPEDTLFGAAAGTYSAEELAAATQDDTLRLVRSQDDSIRHCAQVIKDYAERGGRFLTISRDKALLQNVRIALSNVLQLPTGATLVRTSPEEGENAAMDHLGMGPGLCILMEAEFAGVSTLPLLRTFKAHGPEAKVIIAATEISPERVALFKEEGADHLVTKPINPNQIIKKAARVLQPLSEQALLMDRAARFLAAGSLRHAEACARKILEQHPDSARGLLMLGDSLRAQERREEAMTAYRDAEAKADMYLAPLKRLSDMYQEDGKREAALECLSKLDSLSPLNLARKMRMGDLHVEGGEMELAVNCFDSALSVARQEDPQQAATLSKEIGETLLESHPDMAARYLRASIDMLRGSKAPGLIATFNRLGMALRAQGKWREAVNAYREAQQVSPHDENLQYNIALAYAEGGEYTKAMERIAKAFQLNPDFALDHAAANFSIGRIHEMGGQHEDAARFYHRALDADPVYAPAQRALRAIQAA